MPRSSSAKIELGDVGYVFRKRFDSGWFTGKVVEILPSADLGYDRRVVYNDGDIEDISLADLLQLAKLDPNINNSETAKKKHAKHEVKSTAAREATNKAGDKRKTDSVAARALYELSFDYDSKVECDSDVDCNPDVDYDSDAPLASRRTGLATQKKYYLGHLKPLFNVGEEVFAAWWDRSLPLKDHDGTHASWFPGRVTSYKEIDIDSSYGPTRIYNILFDDGDVLNDLNDYFVFSKEDYLLSMRNDGVSSWIGVRNETDPRAAKEDKWPRIVGWYVATIDGKDQSYSRLSEALDAYDTYVIQREGKHILPTDLNRPEKWSCFIEESDSDEGIDNYDSGNTKTRKRRSSGQGNESQLRFPSKIPGEKDESKSSKKHKKTPSSNYKGVSYSKQDRKYLAQIDYGGKLHCLGLYKYEADAALAHDKGHQVLFGGFDPSEHNFCALPTYEKAIRTEAENADHSIDVKEIYDAVVEKVEIYLSKIYADGDIAADVEVSNIEGIVDSDSDRNSSASSDTAMYNTVTGNEVAEIALNNNTKHATSESSKELSGDINQEYAAVSNVKTKRSKFFGVYYNKRAKSFFANFTRGRRRHFLGYWKLQADGALAHDRASKLLMGEDCERLNFASRRDYTIHRVKELEKLKVDSGKVKVDSVPSVTAKIRTYLSKIPCPEIDAMNERMANKWSSLLAQESGKKFLDLYQRSIDKFFTNFREDDNARPSDNYSNTGEDEQALNLTADMEVESIPCNIANEAVVSIAESNICEDPAQQSDDDDSLFGSAAEESFLDMECSRALQVDDAYHNLSTSTGERREEAHRINLPIGCPVMWNFVGDTFCTGTVFSAPDNAAMYAVTPTNSNGRDSSSTSIRENELAFGIDCPVFVSPTCGHGSQLLQGKVLFCMRGPTSAKNLPSDSFSYSVIIIKEQNEFQVLKGISAERLKYRIVDPADHVPANNTAPLALYDFHSQMQPSAGLRPASAAEENDSRKSGQFFSSNSTISTEGSAATSPRRLFGDSASSADVKCRVCFPRWLVHDSESRKQLFSYLLRTDSKDRNHQCLQRIGMKSNCSLSIIEECDPFVLIRTKQGKYSTEDLRKAASYLECALLGYVGNDGSRGRLFYDMARSCEFLHPPGIAGSTSVMQRNPFSPDREMGWMNIVKLPYSIEEQKYHGVFIITKSSGVFSRIKPTKCEIKVCGNEFKIPTKFCPPYVWVMGDQPVQVDRAVAIIQEAIHKHMRICGCCL